MLYSTIVTAGFVQSKFDYSLFLRLSSKGIIMLLVNINDRGLTSNSLDKIQAKMSSIVIS